jgi:hypothetical protein
MEITQIYLVENCYGDPNKVYIGKTKNSRKANHKRIFGSQILYTYIDEVESLNRKDWKPLESYWIHQFKQWGFEVMNKNEGGGGVEFMTQESINKRVNNTDYNLVSLKRRSNTDYSKIDYKTRTLKMDYSFNKNPEVIKKRMMSPKYKDPETHKKRVKNTDWIAKAEKCKKPILQYDLNGNFIKEWKSSTDAAKVLNLNNVSITMCCNNKLKSSGNFIWKKKQ